LFGPAFTRFWLVPPPGRRGGAHGGVLDRIDSLLFASVAAFYTIVALT
jgi:predicted CDP-diglyceride synthetase/phosphatidate cytidylyltransferase